MLFPESLFGPKLSMKCSLQYQSNSEFRTLIDAFKKQFPHNWIKKIAKHTTLLDNYFKSYQLQAESDNQNCLQTIVGFRFKILFKSNGLFLNLIKCKHYSFVFNNLEAFYLFQDFPNLFLKKSFQDFETALDSNDFIELTNYFNNVLDQVETRNLYLYGLPNTGKTLFTALFCNAFIKKHGKKVAFISAKKIIFYLKEIWSKKTGSFTFFQKLNQAPLLVIDNLGLENNNRIIRDEFLQNLLQERHNKQRITIFISNDLPSQLIKKYSYNESKQEKIQVALFTQLILKNSQLIELDKQLPEKMIK